MEVTWVEMLPKFFLHERCAETEYNDEGHLVWIFLKALNIICVCVCVCVRAQSVMSDSLQTRGL